MIGSQMVGGLAARAASALVGRNLPAAPQGVRSDGEPRRAPMGKRIPPPPAGDEARRARPAEGEEQVIRTDSGRGEGGRLESGRGEVARADRTASGGRKRASSTAASRPVFTDRAELEKVAGAGVAPKIERRLKAAAKAFDGERFDEALPALRMLAADVPHAAQVRELYGLALYRIGRWADAARELEAFVMLTDSSEQHPVLADCYRALRRWDDVERLWSDLRTASPSAELVTEGRIVAAGALADRGRLPEAVALMEQGFKAPSRPKPYHLRRMYVLADLYERSGALGEARDLFRRISRADPEFFDVVDRVRALG